MQPLFFILMLISSPMWSHAIQVSGLSTLNQLNPGESTQFVITLTSDKDKPELVQLKLCDYRCNHEGQHFFEDAGETEKSNTNWIKLGSFRETINPGEKKDIHVTLQVPDQKELNGSYWSVLLIEPSDPLHTLATSDTGFQLQVKVRYAYHIVTNVGKEKPSLKVIGKGFSDIEARQLFTVDVLNNGNLFLNPKMTVKILNKEGKIEKTLETQTERLYPSSSSRFAVETADVKPGTYQAFLLFDNGDGRIFGDSFDLTVPEHS